MQQDMIVILDLGSHENTMVARAVRELGVYSEIKPHDITAAELMLKVSSSTGEKTILSTVCRSTWKQPFISLACR